MFPNDVDCPINLFTTNINEISGYSNYSSTKIGDKTIYYINKALDQKVLGGLFVDSDLMIKYNGIECKILDISSISELLQHNNYKLYKKSLNFDPYDEESDELDKRGKSYLKACSIRIGKEKNITKIKELVIEFNLNITNNEKVIKPIKTIFIISYFVSLPGYIVSTIFLLILLCSFKFQNNIKTIFDCGCEEHKNKLLIIILFISHIFTLAGSILSIINNLHNLVNGINLKLGSNIIFILIVINYITFSLNILLISFFLGFIIYLFKTPELGSDQYSYYDKDYSINPPNNAYTFPIFENKAFKVEDQLNDSFESDN